MACNTALPSPGGLRHTWQPVMGITSKYIITRCVSQLYNVTIMTNKDITLTHVMTSRYIMPWLLATETSPDPLRTETRNLIVVGDYRKLSKVLSCLRITERLQCYYDYCPGAGFMTEWRRLDPGHSGQEEPFIMSFRWVTYFICEFVQSILFVSQCPQQK